MAEKNVEKSLLTSVAKRVKNDNKTLDEFIAKCVKEVEAWARKNAKEWATLTEEEKAQLQEPTNLVKRLAYIKWTNAQLRSSIINNLKRAPGNLREEEKRLAMYDTLADFKYQCPYSGTLLLGGEKGIHIDHIIPVSMGGPTDDWNCVPVCDTCNLSKKDKNLLDWWGDGHTQQEEYKLVKIYEYMTSKLLDEEIRYEKAKDVKTLYVMTFLHQLLDHIEANKDYIFDKDFDSEKEKIKAIERKLKELNRSLQAIVKKNNNPALKSNKQYYAEQQEMLNFVKGLKIKSYYKIAYTYFDEIRAMREAGKTDAEIQTFCSEKDNAFNFELLYDALVRYKEQFGDFNGLNTHDKIPGTGIMLGSIRTSYNKGEQSRAYQLNEEMIDKLRSIGFPLEEDRKYGWFEDFWEKVNAELKEHPDYFKHLKIREHIPGTNITLSSIRTSYNQGEQSREYQLNKEMIDNLKSIGFPFEETEDQKLDRKYGWFEDFWDKIQDKDADYFKHLKSTDKISDTGITISTIRKSYNQGEQSKQYQLNKEMIDKLKSIGFPFEDTEEQKLDRKYRWFDDFWEKVKAEYDKNHDCFKGLETKQKIPGTSIKLNAIRYSYNEGEQSRKYQLNEEMIDKLREIGFPFEETEEQKLDRKYGWFDDFWEKVKDKDADYFKGLKTRDCISDTGITLNTIRYSYNQGEQSKRYQLNKEIINKLRKIGFPLEEDRKYRWFDDFWGKVKDKNADCFKGLKTKDCIPGTGITLNSIRKSYNKFNKGEQSPGYQLTKEMIDKLKSIGFPFGEPKTKIEDINEDGLSA